MTLGMAGCDEKETQLVMATNAEFPPYEYYDGETIVGIDVEIAQAIADEMGRELVIHDMEFDAILSAVDSGEADIGAAGLTIREDRLKIVDFTVPYTTATQVIIVNADSTVGGISDLNGMKIGVQLATTGDFYAKQIMDSTVKRYDKGDEAVQALLAGGVDAVMIDDEPAKVFVQQYEGIRIIDEAYTEEEYALAVAKNDDALLTEVNAAITKLKESGKLQEIIDRYISAE